ncbi:MAG: leucine-rich repeat domain-containing protein [Oscillospiraceae bacterium]|nr:leucine-rich repeat domain-containing protein [Oscillospiraceae bacterium]
MTMKRIFALVLVLLLFVSPVSARGENLLLSGKCTDTIRFSLEQDGTLNVYGSGDLEQWRWEERGRELPVRRIIVGEGITSIGFRAFAGCADLSEVMLPSSLDHIGREAFAGCVSLAQLLIPEGVRTVEEGAFASCSALRQLWLPDSLTYLAGNALDGTAYLDNQTDFIASDHTLLRYLGSDTAVTIPSGITAIGRRCFADSPQVSDILFPAGITYVGGEAFAGTAWLAEQGEFPMVNGILVAYQGQQEELTLPASVRQIGPYAFAGNGELWKLYLPENCTVIGEYAFAGCDYLRNIQFSSRTRSVGAYAFYECDNLREVLFPEGITRLREGVLWGCRRLSELSIPQSVTVIEDYAFQLCDKLTDLTLPDKLTTIGKSVFGETVGITTIHIPASVTNADARTFLDTFGLRSITVDENHPTLKSEDGVLYSADGSTLICCPAGRERDLTVPRGVTTIGSYAFYYNVRTQRVALPDSVVTIEPEAFLFAGISSVRLSDSSQLTYLGDRAFAQCVSLMPLNLPEGLIYLGREAFANCHEMTTISIPSTVTRIYGPIAPYVDLTEVTLAGDLAYLAADALPWHEGDSRPMILRGQDNGLAEKCASRLGLRFEALEP